MSVLTSVRTTEELTTRTQLPKQMVVTARPQSSWPLPPTQLPGAHLSWTEWVDLQASQFACEPYGEHPSHLEMSATTR
jgi:hypothetical protein